MGIGVNPLVVAATDQPSGAWSGIYLAEDIQLLHQGVENGSWIDGTLGGVGVALDALGLITDPLGTVAAWGVAWLLDHVRPLSEALDALAGDPGQVAANAQTWLKAAGQLQEASRAYADTASADLVDWAGAARTAYDEHVKEHVGGLDALARAAETMSSIVQGTGQLVALVRTLVRDAIAEFVSILAVRLWEWLAEEAATLGIGTPWVIAQVSTLVARWVDKIAHFFRGLVSSLRRIGEVLQQLAHLVENLARRSVIQGRVARDTLLGRTGRDLDGLIDGTRVDHILSGDSSLSALWKGRISGGHLWPGLRGKTAFPRRWSVADVKRYVTDVVTDPTSHVFGGGAGGGAWTHSGKPARFRIYGERDGVLIRVVWEPAGVGIVSAFPERGVPH